MRAGLLGEDTEFDGCDAFRYISVAQSRNCNQVFKTHTVSNEHLGVSSIF